MLKNSNNTAIVVMDIGDPEFLHEYDLEKDINDAFVTYLNLKLVNLKESGCKIVFSNFIGSHNRLLTVMPDSEFLILDDMLEYFKNNKISTVIYTGFHYPVCTHFGRETSSKFLKEKSQNIEVFVCPFLTRPPTYLYGSVPPTDNDSSIKQIML